MLLVIGNAIFSLIDQAKLYGLFLVLTNHLWIIQSFAKKKSQYSYQ